MNSEMISTLAEFISREILSQPARQIEATEPLISSGLIDSLSLVDISLFVEDNYQVLIDDTELNADSFDTLQELEALILSRQS
jgi:acyl carrier protein